MSKQLPELIRKKVSEDAPGAVCVDYVMNTVRDKMLNIGMASFVDIRLEHLEEHYVYNADDTFIGGQCIGVTFVRGSRDRKDVNAGFIPIEEGKMYPYDLYSKVIKMLSEYYKREVIIEYARVVYDTNKAVTEIADMEIDIVGKKVTGYLLHQKTRDFVPFNVKLYNDEHETARRIATKFYDLDRYTVYFTDKQ